MNRRPNENVHFLNCTANNIDKSLEHFKDVNKKKPYQSFVIVGVHEEGIHFANLADDNVFALIGGLDYVKQAICNDLQENRYDY